MDSGRMVSASGIKTERILNWIAESGFDRRPFTRSMERDGHSLPADEYRRRCEEALFTTAGEFDAPAVAVRLARWFPGGALPALELAMKTAATLHEALARHQRYHGIWVPWSLRLRPDTGRRVMHVNLPRADPSNLGANCLRELIFAALLQTARIITAVPLRPVSVSFAHPGPRDISELEEFFDAPLRFHAPQDDLEFDLETMSLSLPGADPEVSEVMLGLLDGLLERSAPEALPIEDRVYRNVLERLDDGVPRRAAVAKALGMSESTLRRALSRRKLSYATVVDRVRSTVARELLATSEQSLTEVALSAGFSDASAFARAFKRAHGETASEYRRRFGRL